MTKQEIQIAELMRALAPKDYQIVNQYPGVSVDPRWPNAEIVVATGNNVTIFVFSSGIAELDNRVCSKILDVNKGTRVVLIFRRERPIPEDVFHGVDRNRFTSFVEFTYPRDTAQLALVLADAEDISDTSLEAAILRILTFSGFRQLEGLPPDKQSFVFTALQQAQGLNDIEKYPLGNSWELYVVKTIYPVLRDLTPYRGLLVTGQFRGRPYVLFKDSVEGMYKTDIERLQELVRIGAGPKI